MQDEKDYWKTLSDAQLDAHNTEAFIDYYELENNDAIRNTIIGLYFSFTTLSTVGFGDYTPRSNVERAIGSFILISGVAMFSFLMGNFIEILGTWDDLKADFDDGDTLARFFGTLRHFNEDDDIEFTIKRDIEAFFDYYWSNNTNQAFSEEQDIYLFNKLPIAV